MSVKFYEWQSKDGTKEGLKYAPGSDPKVDAMLAEGRALAKALADHNKAIANYMARDLGAPEGSLTIYFTRTGDCNVFQPKPRKAKAAKASEPTVDGKAALSKLIPAKKAA